MYANTTAIDFFLSVSLSSTGHPSLPVEQCLIRFHQAFSKQGLGKILRTGSLGFPKCSINILYQLRQVLLSTLS